MPRKKKSILDDDDESGDAGALSIKVNEVYASRFEHNKRREELHRLQAKHPEVALREQNKVLRHQRIGHGRYEEDGEGEEESTSEEEDLGEIPVETEEAIFDTLLRIKRKDPVIYQPEVHFFNKDDEEGEEDGKGLETSAAVKKSKPLYLKDIIARQALEHGAELPSDDEDRGEQASVRAPKAYDAEQERLRLAFITAAGRDGDRGEDGEGDVFGGAVLRELPDGDDDAEAEARAEAGKSKKKSNKKGAKIDKKLENLAEAYFGEDKTDRFLRQYILNKGWVDNTEAANYVPSYGEVVGDADLDDEEDEEYLEEADRFEAAYNFRFEEPGGKVIAGHPRAIEGAVRKDDDRRKRKRAEKAERLKAQEDQHREEVKRLKNLKKKEIEDKLSTLQRVAGAASGGGLGPGRNMDDLLEGDFDAEAWDKQMAEAFNDDYYEADDTELDALLGSLEDPEMELGLDPNLGEDGEEERILGDRGGPGPSAPMGSLAGGAESATSFKELHRRLTEINGQLEAKGGDDADGKAARLACQRAEVNRLLEEYYKLDFEDNIGGLKTRFRYKDVPAQHFGLSTEDILSRPDRELNQVIGLKRLAPYQEDPSRIRPNYKALEQMSRDPGSGHHKKARKQNKDVNANKKWDCSNPYKMHKPEGNKQQKHINDTGGRLKSETASVTADGKATVLVSRHHGNAKRAKNEGDKNKTAAQRESRNQGQEMDAAAARMASYGRLELRRGAGGGSIKSIAKDGGSQPAASAPERSDGGAAVSEGPKLSRAQKKNLRRSMKRAQSRGSDQ